MIAFALSADQVAKSLSSEESLTPDFFGLLRLAQAKPDVTINHFEAYVESRQEESRRQLQETAVSEETEVIAITETVAEDQEELVDPNELPENIRDLTIYPEPFISNESIRKGGFFIYLAGKSWSRLLQYSKLNMSMSELFFCNFLTYALW